VAWQAWRGYDRLFYFRDYAGALFDLDATDTLTWDQVDYPQNISVDYLRGLCYMGLKDYDRAIEYFKKFAEDEATKVGEEFIDEAVFLYLGKIYFERLEMSKAEH
jgi:tetratricopeptide (TPR) repeat protein